ncbi:Aldehyde dehydrogenase [Fasciolopsis buskii]|uniref:Aldehyde dehydrogenase n=1 Tax=Fasciolopsis buskii TaxID=27845 RepID=A0A8E0VJ32_9TREM|nr:Aldehyde dehydrogenase [Fasciolopsis buski]
MMEENEDAIIEAVMKDLRRPKHETMVTEILPIMLETNVMLSNIDGWTKDEYTHRTFISMLDTAYIQREPYGLVVIFGSWNYPFLMTIAPLVGALAAGNTAILKPSEFSPASSALIAELIPKYIDHRVCQVLEGDVTFSQQLLKEERFDYIFFTGGYEAGRSVYTAAANHVTPVTLELGGKCPTYVDSNVNLMMAVKRILTTKIMNAGQTCVTTDYVLCHKDSVGAFREAVCKTLKDFFGDDPKQSASFGRIVNEHHYKRLTHLLANTRGKILCGGESSAEDLYVAPTVVVNVSQDDVLMRDEIFGPILPVVEVESAAEAIEIINSKNKPLAVYVYTDDANVFANFKHGTSSGAICQNDCCTYLLRESDTAFWGGDNRIMGFIAYLDTKT